MRCSECNVRHFCGEQSTDHYSTCYGNGKIVFIRERRLEPTPEILRQLFIDDKTEAKYFQNEMRNVNNDLVFASLIAKNQHIIHRSRLRVFTIFMAKRIKKLVLPFLRMAEHQNIFNLFYLSLGKL